MVEYCIFYYYVIETICCIFPVFVLSQVEQVKTIDNPTTLKSLTHREDSNQATVTVMDVVHGTANSHSGTCNACSLLRIRPLLEPGGFLLAGATYGTY